MEWWNDDELYNYVAHMYLHSLLLSSAYYRLVERLATGSQNTYHDGPPNGLITVGKVVGS
jgi:hypothetical protein